MENAKRHFQDTFMSFAATINYATINCEPLLTAKRMKKADQLSYSIDLKISS